MNRGVVEGSVLSGGLEAAEGKTIWENDMKLACNSQNLICCYWAWKKKIMLVWKPEILR